MSICRENRNLLLDFDSKKFFGDEQFCLLFDINISSNRDFEYLNFQRFDLSEISDVDSIAAF